VTEHLPLSTWTGHTPVRRERMMPRLIRYVYPRADAIIAVSNGVADDVSRVSGIRRSSIDVIYNPVIAERLERRASEPLDDPWYAEGQPPVVLGIGRLAPQKDFTTLIDAVARARERIECRLEILGEGDQRRSLEAHVRERGMDGFVRLPGFVANPYPRLRAAAVLALSSKREGLPTVLLEGLCLGVPMVSTDCRSGPHELLDGGRLGRLVPVGDAAALGDAIAATLLEPPHPRDPAEMERYRLDRVVAAYAEHLGL
ncbi:MAG: glycosyltransferase, partial [Gaiellales bacterium]